MLNCAAPFDFEELLFWGRVGGLNRDYYIAMGVTFSDKYEFPEKRFYWASSADFIFKPFPALNDQHRDKYDSLSGYFSGDAGKIHIKVEPDVDPDAVVDEEQNLDEEAKEIDPLASSEEEDPLKNFIARNLTELDRLHYTVLAIENDCHIVPQGAFKLTEEHEVRRNNAFRGLTVDKAMTLVSYSHFRNV